MTERVAIDRNDPRMAAELAEIEELSQPQSTDEQREHVMRRIFAWCLEGPTLAKQGFRLRIAAAKLQMDPTAPSLHTIAKMAGYGRSAAHNQAEEFSELFGVRGPHDRSESTRKACARAYRETHRPQVLEAVAG